MTTVEGPVSSGLVARIKNIIVTPKTEWEVIDKEPATVQGLFTGYICLLAAIPAVCTMIGNVVFLHYGVVGSVLMGVVTYVASLLSAFLMGFIIDALAPSFGGEKNLVQAMKVIAYSSTPVYIAGILDLFPPIRGIAGLIGLYSLYLIYLSLPSLMEVKQDKALTYTIVAIIVAIVVNICIGMAIASIALMSIFTGVAATGAALSGV